MFTSVAETDGRTDDGRTSERASDECKLARIVGRRYGRPEARFIDRLRRGRPAVSAVAGDDDALFRSTDAVCRERDIGETEAGLQRDMHTSCAMPTPTAATRTPQGHHHHLPYTVLLCCVLTLPGAIVERSNTLRGGTMPCMQSAVRSNAAWHTHSPTSLSPLSRTSHPRLSPSIYPYMDYLEQGLGKCTRLALVADFSGC